MVGDKAFIFSFYFVSALNPKNVSLNIGGADDGNADHCDDHDEDDQW